MTATAVFADVDLVLLAVRDNQLQVLLERDADRWRLPGRAVGHARSLDAEAGLVLADRVDEHQADAAHVEQLATAGPVDGATRGRPGRVVSCAYLALVSPTAAATTAAAWTPTDDVLAGRAALADVAQDLTAAAVDRTRTLLERTTAAAALCPPAFTVPELHAVYEAVWGLRLDLANFRRKVTGSAGFLEPTGKKAHGRGRPALVYRRGPAAILNPPMVRLHHDDDLL